MAADSNLTKEILTSEKQVPGGTVRVYYKFDEHDRPVGEPRIVFVGSETAEEVPTKLFSDPIESLRERQDRGILETPTTQCVGTPLETYLETYLRLKMPISLELVAPPKRWLNEDNWLISVEQMIGCMEFRQRQDGLLPHETLKTLKALKEVQKEIEEKQNCPIAPIATDALLKLSTSIGMDKLTSLFADLEQQGMVAEGTTANLANHFTESALKKAVPDGATQIDWKGRKYELVHLLRRLRGSGWLNEQDTSLEPRFTLKGKPFKMRHYPIKTTDKLERIESILKKHL